MPAATFVAADTITVNTFGATTWARRPPRSADRERWPLRRPTRRSASTTPYIPDPSNDLTVTANVAGTAGSAYVGGLREGVLWGNNNGSDFATPNPGLFTTTTTRMGELGETVPGGVGNPFPRWGNNQTWVYTGQVYDADGIFSLAGWGDDFVWGKIDGIARLSTDNTYSATWNSAGTTGSTIAWINNNTAVVGNPYGGMTNFGMGPKGDGWHDIEVRFGNGGGGAGPNGTPSRLVTHQGLRLLGHGQHQLRRQQLHDPDHLGRRRRSTATCASLAITGAAPAPGRCWSTPAARPGHSTWPVPAP